MISSIKQFFSEQDKQKHMAGSAIGANILFALLANPLQALLLMLIIGLIKEATDNNTMVEHGRDMLANLIGASTVLIWLIFL
jgi:hypothetical protein